MGKDPDEIRQEIEATRGRMGDTVDAIAYKADVPNRVQDAVGERVDSLRSSVTGTIGAMRDRVADVVPDPDDVRRATSTSINAVRQNPLGLFFGSAAVGFLLGSLLPASEIENQRLGELSDRLKQSAQTAGGQILQQGKAVVKDTIDAAKDAAAQSAMQHGTDIAQNTMASLNREGSEGA